MSTSEEYAELLLRDQLFRTKDHFQKLILGLNFLARVHGRMVLRGHLAEADLVKVDLEILRQRIVEIICDLNQ